MIRSLPTRCHSLTALALLGSAILAGCATDGSGQNDPRATRRGEAYVDAYGVVRVKPTIREAPVEPIRFGTRSGEVTGRGEVVPETTSSKPAEKPTELADAAGPFGRDAGTGRRTGATDLDGSPINEASTPLAGGNASNTNATGAAQPNLRPDPALTTPGNPINPGTAGNTSTPQTGGWTIILSTVSGESHRAQAQQRLAQLQQSLPALNRAQLISADRGTMITFGRYESPDDPRAQADLKMIKELTLGPMKPFAMSMLNPMPDQSAGTTLSPHDLRSLRRQFPNTNPLYTLDVAVWIASPQDGFPWEEMKRRAEAYAAQLRQQGVEAYFYHNEGQRVSSVTVGKFDRRAIDQASGFYSVEVRSMLEKFPRRLTNGQEVMVKVNPADENSKLKPQEPQLVEVPRNF